MASVLPPPAPTKLDDTLDQELGKATGRIRLNDLLAGGLALAVLTLAFAAAAILFDRWLELPAWVRQVLLAGFALTFAAVSYFALLRPLRRAVNPRFAARRVEETIPEAKNALINWVDLRDKDLPPVVRAAVGSKAVEGVTAADVNKAVESRRVVWLAVTAGLLVAVLAALFVVFKPAPFLSLVGRTFNPFTVTKIASRTELSIEKPDGGDATVTAGEPVTVRVYVGGSVPDPEGPDRVRLRVRYNPAVPEYDDLPLDPGGSAREWVLQVPQSVVQNGFWYRVAGGDAETAEHRVTVRSRPLFREEFEAHYEYPAYTRLKPEVSRDRNLWGYAGTEVTLTATTNRPVKKAWLDVDSPGLSESLDGRVVGEAGDTIRYRLTLKQSGTYRMAFTSADDGQTVWTPPYGVKVATDLAPRVQITSPAEDEITLPANGLLAVDATLNDDFGLTGATLKVRQINDKGEAVRDFKSKPYRGGKPLLRESDKTYPTRLEYKDSVAFEELTVEPGGQPADLKEGMVLQYWVEAKDNCTEPKANVGKSAVKRVKIAAPPKEPEKKEQQQQARQQRGAEEQQHRQQQDQQLQGEKRDPPPQPRPEQQPDTKPQDDGKGSEGSKDNARPEEPKTPNEGGTKETKDTEPKPGGTDSNPTQPKDATSQPMSQPKEPTTQPAPASQPRESNPKPTGDPQSKQGGNPDEQKSPSEQGTTPPQNDPNQVEMQAQDVQKAIDQQNRQPGDARNQDPDQAKPAAAPADKKPTGQPPSDGQAEPKSGQPTGDPSGQSKPQGNLEQPKPSDTKPEPKPADGNTQQGNPGSEATGNTPKHPPVAGNTPAQVRPQPKEPSAGSGTGEKKPGDMKPTDSSAARGSESPPPGQPEQRQPAGETKPKPEATRGAERPKDGTGAGQANPEERPAEARGPKPTDPGARKQPPAGAEPDKTPMAGEKPQPGSEGTDPKQSPSAAKPEASKPQPGANSNDPNTKPMTGQPRPEEMATEKSAQPCGGQGETKVDPKEIEQAAKDLASGDPQKQQAARDKLDKLMGKKAREQAEREAKRIAEDLKSDDPARRQAAEQKLKDLAKQAGRPGAGQGEPKIDPKEIEQAARDLASGDPQKQQAARDKLDKLMGKEAREQAERDAKQLAEDLQSKDAATRQAAEQKLKDLAEKAEQHAGKGDKGKPLSDAEKQKLREMAKDLTSDDKARREAAEKQVDDMVGKGQREQIQQAARDADKAVGPKGRADAERRFEEAMKDAGQGTKGKQPSAEELQKWADKAKDLNSPDQGKREAAEKEFDDKFGKEAREQLQKDMRDPKKVEEAQKKFQEMAKNINKDIRTGGGAGRGQEGSRHEGDPRNRLKSAELQLKTFEEYRNNKELQNKLGYTQEEYDQFLKSYQQRVAQMREEVAKQDQPETAPAPSGPAALQVGEGSSGTGLKTRSDGTRGTTGGAGPGTAPSGYSDAQRKFAEQAAKLRKGQDKK